MNSQNIRGFRAPLLHFTDRPEVAPGDPARTRGLEYYRDGVLLVGRDGCVLDRGPAERFAAQGFDVESCEHFPGRLLMPGMIDSHCHSPQTQVMGSYGKQLIDWLEGYTFPAEQKFSDRSYAEREAEFFIDQLLAHGTTTAMVYTTVFPQSTDAFFQAAQQRRLRMIAGKVLMDRNAPEALTDTPESAERDSRALIERWHGRDRLLYALTPRFAPTSSAEQLQRVGTLLSDYPGLYLQTHLSENLAEIEWVRSLYPERRDYLDVYDHFGLLGPRSVFGHGVHLSDRELRRMADTGSSIAFCPTSNLFLGSGLLDCARAEDSGVGVSLATDVGGGTSFSLLRTLAEAYKVLQLQGQSLHPLEAFYWVTLGNARHLGLDAHIGNFETGKEADFIVVDPGADSLQAYRQSHTSTLSETLFALQTLGDGHNIERAYILGELAHRKHDTSSGAKTTTHQTLS